MILENINISVEVYENHFSLEKSDRELLESAADVLERAYSPYSNFSVAAALRLENDQIVTGTNQENISFPAGLCAERVALSAASSLFPNFAIKALAVTYFSQTGNSDHPISPCGICRQTLSEYEQRFGQTIRLVLGGKSGPVYVIPRSSDLLPLAFSF